MPTGGIYLTQAVENGGGCNSRSPFTVFLMHSVDVHSDFGARQRSTRTTGDHWGNIRCSSPLLASVHRHDSIRLELARR